MSDDSKSSLSPKKFHCKTFYISHRRFLFIQSASQTFSSASSSSSALQQSVMDFEGKKSGQIPAFGNWEYANDLPITQYFECARQAGLIRHASSVCECGPCVSARGGGGGGYANDDLYSTDLEKPPIRIVAVPPRKTSRGGNGNGNNMRRSSDFKEQKKQVKVYDVKEQPRNQLLSQKQFPKQADHIITQRSASTTAINVKPRDEDLYKIPPELLHNSKRKKMLGFFSRCLVPPCKA